MENRLPLHFIDIVPSKVMRLVTFRRPGAPAEAGMVSGDKIIGLGADMLSVIASGVAPGQTGPAYDTSSVTSMAPIPRPPKLICVGLNYRAHAIEAKMEMP